jgi:hypothetical protein
MEPELTQPPEGYEARRGTLAAEYVLALSKLRRSEMLGRRWRSAALIGWSLSFVLPAMVAWFQ